MKHTVEEVKLDNGASGLLIDVPGASVMSMNVCFRAGNRFVRDASIYEVAHLMEHMAFGRNAEYKDAQAYESDFTKNGAYHNAWTSDFFISYEAECADFEWERILMLQELAIARPCFNDDDLRSEKGNVRSELTGYQNDYARLMWPKLQQELGEAVLTYAERLRTIKNIEVNDIREHHRRTHTAKNMCFVVAGDLKGRKKRIVQMLEGWKLAEGERFEFPVSDFEGTLPVVIRRKDASNLSFGFSFVVRRDLNDQEVAAMNCLCHILCGTMSSKILGTARKRGIVYGMDCGIMINRWSTTWDFDGEVNSENAEELFDLIAVELARVINGDISEADLEAARSYMLGRNQMAGQTVSQIANYYIGHYATYGEVGTKRADLPKLFEAVDKRMLVSLAREFMQSGASGLAVVGDIDRRVVDELWNRILGVI